jgi:hypothetical protein
MTDVLLVLIGCLVILGTFVRLTVSVLMLDIFTRGHPPLSNTYLNTLNKENPLEAFPDLFHTL